MGLFGGCGSQGDNWIWILILIFFFCGGCGNGFNLGSIGGCGTGCGDNDNSIIWIIILLFFCCGNNNNAVSNNCGCGC